MKIVYFVLLTALNIVGTRVANSWVVTPYSDVVKYQCFGGPCCFHLQGEVNAV
jgi:hypothetical protein